jgi:hypothetical protein
MNINPSGAKEKKILASISRRICELIISIDGRGAINISDWWGSD